MSLQSKFAMLLGLLAVTLGVILGAALTFGGFLEGELVRPFEESTQILRGIEAFRRRAAGESEAQRAGGEAARSDGADRSLEMLRASAGFGAMVGAHTGDSLRALLDGARARGDYGQLFEFIDSINARVLSDAPRAIAYGGQLRRIYRTLIISGIVASILFAGLCAVLVRRWVIVPVNDLRAAALRIGQGDFEHRVALRAHDELGILSAEVNNMAGMISRAQREAVERERLAATGEMVRRLAHNIRNPLSAIRSIAEISRRRAEDDAMRADQTEIITLVDRFNNWLGALLGVTAPIGINPERSDVASWVASVLETMRPLARMRSVELVIDIERAPAEAVFDPRHLNDALIALITNAIQASPSGGKVWLSASADPPDSWLISVKDEGRGIPNSIREHLFRPYFTTKRDGTGIGLALAQQVVRGHGGEIHVGSSQNEGATFSVRIPIDCSSASGAAVIHHQAEPSRDGAERGTNSGHRR